MAIYEFSVSVRPQYLEAHSNPDEQHFVFAYTVTIRNTGERTAKLISRHWIITDGNNQVEEVRATGGRRAAGAQAGRFVRVHERLPPADAGGLDARLVPLRGR